MHKLNVQEEKELVTETVNHALIVATAIAHPTICLAMSPELVAYEHPPPSVIQN